MATYTPAQEEGFKNLSAMSQQERDATFKSGGLATSELARNVDRYVNWNNAANPADQQAAFAEREKALSGLAAEKAHFEGTWGRLGYKFEDLAGVADFYAKLGATPGAGMTSDQAAVASAQDILKQSGGAVNPLSGASPQLEAQAAQLYNQTQSGLGVKVPDPSFLSSYREDQIVRQPNGDIYLKPGVPLVNPANVPSQGATAPAPITATAPTVPTVTSSPSGLGGTNAPATTNAELQALLAKNATLGQQMQNYMQQSAAGITADQGTAADFVAQINAVKAEENAAMQGIRSQAIPLGLLTGQAAELDRQYQGRLSTLVDAQKVLADRLQIKVDERKLKIDEFKTMADFNKDTIALQLELQEAADKQVQSVIDRASKASAASRDALADALDIVGENREWKDLNAAEQSSWSSYAKANGIDLTLFKQAAKAQKDGYLLDNAKKISGGGSGSGSGSGTTGTAPDPEIDALAAAYNRGETLGSIGATTKAKVLVRAAELKKQDVVLERDSEVIMKMIEDARAGKLEDAPGKKFSDQEILNGLVEDFGIPLATAQKIMAINSR